MKARMLTDVDDSCDRIAVAALTVPVVLFPGNAYAVQVGCFVTAVLLGITFFVGFGVTAIVKHFLVRYVGKASKTPWLRMFGITWLELLLGIVLFVLIRTNFWLTVLIYLPIAALMNRALLAKRFEAAGPPAAFAQRYGLFPLLSLALPVSFQLAISLWTAVTNLITFTDLQM